MSRGSVRCALLDLGKVLVDFTLDPFRVAVERWTGVGADQLRAALLPDDLPHRYETGMMSDGEFHREVSGRLGKEIPFDDFAAAWNSIFLETPLLPDAWLAAISDRVPIWIVSNTNPLHFRHIRRSYSFFSYVRGCVLSYEVGAAKPDPRIFETALRAAGCEACEAVFVDDQPVNVAAAAGLGVDALPFLSPAQFGREMRARGLL